MTTTTKPDKRRTREWLDNRTHSEDPPPTPDEIRRQLGWALAPIVGNEREVPD